MPHPSARILRTAFAALMLCLLSACANMGGKHDFRISMAELQDNLDQRFPRSQRVLEMFDIELASPKITTIPDENRIQAHFAMVLAPPLTSKTWRGSLTLSGALRPDATKNAIFLRDAKVEDFTVTGADAAYKRQFVKISGLLLDHVLRDIPLYIFSKSQTKQLGTDYSLVKISAQQDALVLSFEPTK